MTSPGFPIVHCDDCDRDALVTRDVDERGSLIARCIHCERVLDLDEARFVEAESLRELGYTVEGLRHPHEERGCRDGGCGIQQPEG